MIRCDCDLLPGQPLFTDASRTHGDLERTVRSTYCAVMYVSTVIYRPYHIDRRPYVHTLPYHTITCSTVTCHTVPLYHNIPYCVRTVPYIAIPHAPPARLHLVMSSYNCCCCRPVIGTTVAPLNIHSAAYEGRCRRSGGQFYSPACACKVAYRLRARHWLICYGGVRLRR